MNTTSPSLPLLTVDDLHVYYGVAHALQGVSIRLDRGVLAIVGRNGMGKTTLCNAVMGLVPASKGSVKLGGEEITGLSPNQIVQRGVGYVPQGRRIWPSLSVDEHLRLVAKGNKGAWTIERVYETFPRLAERKRNGGAELSGGEQQMLAISRSLLANPRLLVMDEPTEGLAPVIVEQVEAMLRRLADEGEISVLLVEQNLGVAMDIAERVAVMVNGRIARVTTPAELGADRDLQQRLLGVRASDDVVADAKARETPAAEPVRFFRVVRSGGDAPAPTAEAPASVPPQGFSTARAPTMWAQTAAPDAAVASEDMPAAEAPPVTVAAATAKTAYVAGTFDTKGRELLFLRNCLVRLGVRTTTVDLSTSGRPSPADIGPAEVARFHPKGGRAVFTNDRGSAVTAMAEAFERFMVARRDVGGLISAGGSGGTALATPAMRRLAVGVPRVMVSTVASGDVKRYVGSSDICMMYSVTDVSGINRISERVLSNAAHALAGMILYARDTRATTRPAIGLTMFGVTTPCVQAVQRALEDEYDCLVFHATGTGGQSMEKLADSGLLTGVIDVSTTEVCDLLMGGVMSAGEDRIGSIIRSRIPYVGSCGALDMVNFGPMDTVPERYRNRKLYVHNAQVTLMRTTPEENAAMGRWIADKLNRCEGPVRFIIPEGGVSMLDAPGKAFHDPEADAALFGALTENFRASEKRRLIRLPYNINEPPFAQALVAQFREIAPALEAA
jgi:uncharacterized protein (UPF0261 family)/ABC-type branched-subunit amino acid transport system ATPase component